MSGEGGETQPIQGPEPAPVQPTPEGDVRVAGEKAKKAADSRVERSADPKDDGRVFDEQAKRELEAAVKEVVPELEQKKQETLVNLIASTHETTDHKPEELNAIAAQLKDAGFNRYQTEGILRRARLSQEERQQILEQFPEMTEEERQQAKAEDENFPDDKKAQKMEEKAKAAAEQIESVKKAKLKEIEQSGLDDDEKDKLREKVSDLYSRFTGFFGPEEPGRIWTRRLGKTAYISFLVFALLVVYEMNLINKMAKKPRGG